MGKYKSYPVETEHHNIDVAYNRKYRWWTWFSINKKNKHFYCHQVESYSKQDAIDSALSWSMEHPDE